MAHVKKMLVEDWIAVAPNPIQRDTERHLAKAKHLHTPMPTHSVVSAAELPGGKLIKLDGHTRALGWKRKMFPAPVQVLVNIFPVKDLKEAEDLYKTLDSKAAVETTRDKVSGAYNRHNFEPQSDLLQSGGIVSGLRLAYGILIGGSAKTFAAGGAAERGPNGKDKRSARQISTASIDEYLLINEWSYELHMLDGFGLRRGDITSGVLGAFLVSARKYGHRVTPFWTGVFGNGGSRTGGQMDGVQAVHELILANRGKSGHGNNRMHIADVAARCLNALEKWLKDEWLYTSPRPMDTLGYLTGYEKPNEKLIKAADKHKQGARS